MHTLAFLKACFSLVAVFALMAGRINCAVADDIPWVWHSSGAPGQSPDIAVLLDHLSLSGDAIEVRRRMRRLVVDEGVRVTPVVHVQMSFSKPPDLGPRQTHTIVRTVRAAAQRSTSGWVQLDFEVPNRLAEYYFSLVAAIRRDLPPTIKLSVTVMASMCKGQPLEKLQADEVVPMFFRMGESASYYWQTLSQKPEQLNPRCRQQAGGFAIQEIPPLSVQRRYDRRYWFNYKNWDNTFKGE